MARGWESKAVADQLEQTDVRPTEQSEPHETSPAVRARRERLESLRLTHSLTLAQIERPITRAHRDMLERKLRALEKEIEELS
jgi:hypothetical protein